MLSQGNFSVEVNIIQLAILIQLAVFVVVGLITLGINLPVIRQAIVLFYLLFVPGIAILNLLDVRLDPIDTMLLSIGISISAVTFLSSFWSVISSPFFDTPLSETLLTVFLGAFTIVCFLFSHGKVSNYQTITLNLQPSHVLLLFLPVFIAFGKVIENYTLISAALAIVALLPLLTLLWKKDQKIYPLIILVMALSITFLNLLYEYRFNIAYDDQYPSISEAVGMTGAWDPKFPVAHNSLLLPTIFSPVYSILSGLNVVIGFRFIGCIITSIIPIILYVVYRNFFNTAHSFLAASLYTFYPFFTFFSSNMKSTYAFFFISLILLVIFNEKLTLRNKRLLLLIFGFSIITSHYGTTYVFVIILLLSFLLQQLEKLRGLSNDFIFPNYIILIIVMSFTWYLYTSNEMNLDVLVDFTIFVFRNIQDFFTPESPTVNAFITNIRSPSISLEITKWLIFVILALILIGTVKLFYLHFKKQINKRYATLAFPFAIILLGVTITAGWRNMGLSLLLTAPLAVLGFLEMLNFIKISQHKRLLLFTIYLLILFAFTFGLVANVLNITLGKMMDVPFLGYSERDVITSDLPPQFKRSSYTRLYLNRLPDSTFEAVKWFFIYQNHDKTIFIDVLLDRHGVAFYLRVPKEYGGMILHNFTQPRTGSIEKVLSGNPYEGYVFLAYHNIHDDFIYIEDRAGNPTYFKTSNYHSMFKGMNKIYDSGGGVIYEWGGSKTQ